MPQNNNPFEEFGGQEVATEEMQDPFAEFGGNAIDVKKKNGQLQNGSSVLEPQSEQELLPFKSPTNQTNDKVLGSIYSKYPGLKVLGNVTLKADATFTRDKTGGGDIEYFSPTQDTVRYSDSYKYPHPKMGTHGIVYNPKTNNEEDIMLDMLHGMAEADPNYAKLHEQFKKQVLIDMGDDAEYFYQKAKKEGNAPDGKEAWMNNYVDGLIRSEISESKTGDYAVERKGNSAALKDIASQIKSYLQKDTFKSPIPETTEIDGDQYIRRTDGNWLNNSDGSTVSDKEVNRIKIARGEAPKSPTTILSESGGGGSFFPDDVKGGAALPEPPITLEQYFQKNPNIIVPKENALSPFQLKTVQQQQNDVRMIGADIAKTTPERQDPNIQQALKKLQVNPNDDAAIYQLGYGNLGKNNTAAQGLFEQALQINPNNYKAKIGLADISFVNGDFGAALKFRQDAMSSIPKTVTLADGKEYNNPDYANNVLGIAQAQALIKQNLDEAQTAVDGILRSDPKNVLALQVKADIKRQQGHDIEAKDLTWQAVAANSENTPAPTLYNLEQKWKREHPEADEDTFIAQWLQSHADVANKIAMEMGGNQGAGEFVANIIDPVGYVMGNVEGVKQGIHHMGEGIAQMNENNRYTKAHVVGLTKAILGGTEGTFATLMTTPHGFAFIQGLHGADLLTEDEANKFLMSPLTSYFPAQDELEQNMKAIGDLAINLALFAGAKYAMKGETPKAKQIREAAQRLKEGKPISKDDTRMLTEVVSEEANPQTLQKVIEATEKIPDDATNTLEAALLIAAKKEATERIQELQSEKATLDEVYQTQKDKEIADVEKIKNEANEELKSITEQKKQDIPEEPTIEKTAAPTEVVSVQKAAKELADKIGGVVVGSMATGKVKRGDIDIRIDGDYNAPTTEKKLIDLGFEFTGSSSLSPKEMKLQPKKTFGEGWQRIEHFQNDKGQKIDVWHDDIADKAGGGKGGGAALPESLKASNDLQIRQEPTQLTEPQPKTKLQLAKEKFEESFKQAQENRKKTDTNLGAIKDPLKEAKKQAELDRKTFDDLVDYAREGINEEFKTLKAFIERIPEEIKKHAEIAWKVANNTLKYEDAVKEVERLGEGRDIPPIEPPKGKTDVIEGEPPKEVSGIKKALVSDEIIEGVNLDKIGDKEMMDLGRKILDTGEVKPEAIITNIVSTGKGVLTPKEVVALITHKADLDTALRDAYKRKNEIVEKGEQRGEDLGVINAEINALEGKINNFDVMAVITANQQSMAFRLRKMMLDKDYNVVTQIEKYKANNDGYIPPEVEARFRELGKELDDVKAKLAEAEEAKRLRDEQDAAANITEDVGRKKKRGEISEEEVIQKVKEGIEAEINDIHSKLSPERKRFADKAIAALERIQEKIRKNTYSDATGMLAIVDAGITTIKRAIKAGVAVADAIELGIKKIKDGLSKQGIKDWAKENDFRKDMIEGFEAEKVSTTKPKKDTPEIKDDGSIKIPNEMIRGLVERGITEIGELTDAVHAEVVKELPNATTRQVRDAITDYGRTVNPTADVIQTQVNAAKRVGRLLSELEDLQAGKSKAKGKQLFKLTEREKDLKRQINALTKNAGLTPEQISLKDQKVRAKNRITELEKRLREKDFSKKPKPIKSTDTEIVELNKEKERLQEEFDKAQYENELKNRTFWQKAEDVGLEITNGVFRGLVASLDFSAMFIQGLWRLATSPKQSVKALGESFRQFASEKRQEEWMNNLKAQEFYPLIEASKLSITKTEGKIAKREELFISNWINLIYNGLGKVITLGHEPSYNVWKRINPYKATGRAFTGYTNAIRVSAFLEGAKYLERKGLSFESNPKDFQKWADHVNTVTGRGSLGKAEQSAGWLSTIFFAPRKMIADLKLFTPYVFVYYARFPKAIRQKAVLDYAQAITTVVAANALLWAARRDEDDTEADQFWNPISTNFLTHQFGNTAVSITGGLRTNIVFMSRLLSGKYTDQYGFKSKLGDRYGKQINTRQDLVENFLSNKFSPLISLANKKLDEKKGLELEKSEYTNLAIPMWLQDVRELYKENPKEIGAMMNLLAVFGASVRTIDTHTADSIKHNGKDVELTAQQQEEFSNIYTEKESEYLEKLVNDDLFINADEDKQIQLKQMINDAARNDAEKELKNLYPESFQETPEEKEAREKEKQDLEDLKIRLGIIETPATDPRTPQPSRTQEPNRETTTPSR